MTVAKNGSSPFRELGASDLDDVVEPFLLGKLRDLIVDREPGHCMRVDDLGTDLARRLCARMRTATNGAEVHVLADPAAAVDAATDITSTKLVELRNPRADGSMREPLLVFVPPGLRVSAEDSFGAATFERIDLGDVYGDLAAMLYKSLSQATRILVDQIYTVLNGRRWNSDSVTKTRFLATIQLNHYRPEYVGAALFVMGLVPDFELHTDPDQARLRLMRNVEVVDRLSDPALPARQRVFELRLTETTFSDRLAEFAATHGLNDSTGWTRLIAVDRDNWRLNFDNWPLPGGKSHDSVSIELADLDLPIAGARAEDADHPVLSAIAGQPYLPVGDQGLVSLAVRYHVEPNPLEVGGLARFRTEIVAEDGEEAEVVTHTTVSRKTAYKATLKNLRKTDWDGGWYIVRVTGVDKDGIPLPHARARDAESARRRYESAPFYVLPDGDADQPSDNRGSNAVGVSQALRELQFSALAEGRDPAKVRCRGTDRQPGSERGGAEPVEARFGADGRRNIVIPTGLARVQERLLADPDSMRAWSLRLGPLREIDIEAQSTQWSNVGSEAVTEFRAARKALFDVLGGDGAPTAFVETHDLAGLSRVATEYARCYDELVSRWLRRMEHAAQNDADDRAAARRDLNQLLRMDTVSVEIEDKRGRVHECVLVAPTHPMRLLWLVSWDRLAQHWIAGLTGADRSAVLRTRSEFFGSLGPLGFPLVVPRADGRLVMAAHDLSPYWGVLLPTETEDVQELVGLVEHGLGTDPALVRNQNGSSGDLVDQLSRYLSMHPYVRLLVLNVVNCGRGERLALALADLGKMVGEDLRFEVRIFVSNPEASGTSDVFGGLLRTGELVGASSTQELSDLSERLIVSIRPLDEFLAPDADHTAHITVLLDAFSGERFSTAPEGDTAAPVPAHGLVQRMDCQYVEDESVVAWHRSPRHGTARPIPGADELGGLMARLPRSLSAAAAAVATGTAATGVVPRTTLSLDKTDRMMLHKAHQVSDWVLTFDRTLGIEYFDTRAESTRPPYLIDCSPARMTALGQRVIVSSRFERDLAERLLPTLARHGLVLTEPQVAILLRQARLLSGRFAFDLSHPGSDQQVRAIAVLLARLFLQRTRRLRDCVLMPLANHPELAGDGPGVDLALVEFNLEKRSLSLKLIAVDCHQGESLGHYEEAVRALSERLRRAVAAINDRYAPLTPDRPDRPMRNLELAEILRFHLDRAIRQGELADERVRGAYFLLDSLDSGYVLSVTSSAIVFDLHSADTDTTEELGVELCRVGRDDIADLLSVVAAERVEQKPSRSGDEARAEGLPPMRETAPDRPLAAHDEDTGIGAPIGPPDVFIGSTGASPQYGVIGSVAGRKVAIDLNETHTMSLFGVQGGGKSYTLGSIVEMAGLAVPPVNLLPLPLATIVFHYSATQDYAPEFTSMVEPNSEPDQVETLLSRYGVAPVALPDVVMLAPEDQVAQRQVEYPSISVHPLHFDAAELRAEHWRFLMGAVGNPSNYLRHITRIMRASRDDLTIDAIRRGVEDSALPARDKRLAGMRLDLAADFIAEGFSVKALVRPGRLIIVDLRDEYIEKGQALGLFVVLMQLFAEAQDSNTRFNKLVVFDEAHKYIDSPNLIDGLVESVREMRHKGMSVLVASQDPPSVPRKLIELSDHVVLHRFSSPAWLKHVQGAVTALSDLTPSMLAKLKPGEAYVWAGKSSDPAFTAGAVKVQLRPRLTRHGGETKTATGM